MAHTAEGTPSTAAQVEHKAHEHPSDFMYVKIAIFLAVLTAIEVALSYVEVGNQTSTNALLLVFAAVKFATVALYFMHLKFDNRVLRRLFVTGIVLAIFCYLAYLFTLGVFI